MGSAFSGLGSFFGTLFSPITTVFHWVFFLPVFNILILIYQGVGNFALAIILLTLLIRGALFPLTRRQLSSTRKMQELQPRLKEIQAKHRGDPQATMAAQQALYKEHGVSMYGGCLPLVIQMPFLYALFYSFESVLSKSASALNTVNQQIYPFLPKLTHLPATNFLWTDLATPDKLYILPVVAGILTFIQMRMAMPVRRPGAPSDPTAQTTKTMQYIMPLFTVFIGTRFPAGLALYWTVSTGFSAVQQYLLSGWGSLWVGVPGMERYVPEPKDVTPTTPISAGGAGRGAGRGAAETTEPAKPVGFMASMRALLEQTRDQAQAQALVAQQQQQEKRGRVVEAGEGSGAVKTEAESGAQTRAAQPPSQRDRDKRPRPPKSGAMLVRPAAQPTESGEIQSAADLEASTKGEKPEDRIVRDAQEQMDGIIADAGASLNGAASAPTSATNGAANGASGGQKPQPRPNAPKTSGNAGGQQRNQQSRGRNRKGGR